MKKNNVSIAALLGIISIIGVIPLTVYLTQKNQEIRDKAAIGNEITICYNGGSDCDYDYQAGGNPTVLQQAVDSPNTLSGDTIIIKEGEYKVAPGVEAFAEIEGKTLSIKGEGSDKTRIIGRSPEISSALRYNNCASIVSLLSISGFGGFGIYASDITTVNYSFLNVENNSQDAIFLNNVSQGIINNNNLGNNRYGIYEQNANVSIIANRIYNNGQQGIVSGDVLTSAGNINIENNIIYNNFFEAIFIEGTGGNVKIINNTIYGNATSLGRPGGISMYYNPDVTIINNIIVDNNDKGIVRAQGELDKHTGQLTIDYNDVWHNFVGDQEINYEGITDPGLHAKSEDPLFADSEKHLSENSPMIDAGDPSISDPSDNGIVKSPAKGTVISDMGAYGGTHADYWSGTSTATIIEVCNRDDHFSDGDCEGIPFKYQWCSTVGIEECDPNAIQNAIDDADIGNGIYIKRGEYYLQGKQVIGSIIDKSISIYGESDYSTIIKENEENKNNTAFALSSSSNVNISYFKFNGFGNTCIGIFDNAVGVIHQNIFLESSIGSGVIISNEAEGEISQNLIISRHDGIQVMESGSATIINNTIFRSRVAGINSYNCSEENPSIKALNNIITNTVKNDDGTFGFGIGGPCLHEEGKLNNEIYIYNLIWNNEGDGTDCSNAELCEDFTGRIYSDPLFVSETDFHLQQGSPAIDTGDPEICDLDTTRSDMGVYGGGGTCGVSGNSVKLMLKLERKVVDGISHYTNSKVRVKMVKGDNTIDFFTSINDLGESELVQIGSIENGDYDVYIKPYQYISKKKQINLQQGENTIDFTESEFRVGDLNESSSSYDFMNSLDFSSFIKYFREQDDPEVFKLADLNIDGAVNSVDYSIMIKTYRENSKGELIMDPK